MCISMVVTDSYRKFLLCFVIWWETFVSNFFFYLFASFLNKYRHDFCLRCWRVLKLEKRWDIKYQVETWIRRCLHCDAKVWKRVARAIAVNADSVLSKNLFYFHTVSFQALFFFIRYFSLTFLYFIWYCFLLIKYYILIK